MKGKHRTEAEKNAPLPLCLCGCGNQVKRVRLDQGRRVNQWLKGHHVRRWLKPGMTPQQANDVEYTFRTYGLTPEACASMLAGQDGKCAICRTTSPGKGRGGRESRWSVDHNHTTNAIRGLLCRSCNAAIGLLREDVKILQAAIDYLQRNS